MSDEIRIEPGSGIAPALMRITDVSGVFTELRIEDLCAALDDWAGCYEAEGRWGRLALVYRRLRVFVQAACDHPAEKRSRRRDGSLCNRCGQLLLGQFA